MPQDNAYSHVFEELLSFEKITQVINAVSCPKMYKTIISVYCLVLSDSPANWWVEKWTTLSTSPSTCCSPLDLLRGEIAATTS